MAIPKKIHYCWFGGNPLNKRTLRYIERWKELCPDFEFIRWDETNCDMNATSTSAVLTRAENGRSCRIISG